MNEQEARAIERNLSELLPGCLVEAYGSEEPNYRTKSFESAWKVALYSTPTKEYGTLVAVIRDQQHYSALLDLLGAYYNPHKDIPNGQSFVDQNGKTVIQGQVYTVDEYEQL